MSVILLSNIIIEMQEATACGTRPETFYEIIVTHSHLYPQFSVLLLLHISDYGRLPFCALLNMAAWAVSGATHRHLGCCSFPLKDHSENFITGLSYTKLEEILHLHSLLFGINPCLII